MNSNEKPVTSADKGDWIYAVGPLGILLMLVSKLSHNQTIGAVAAAMLLSAGITGVIGMIRESRKPPTTPRLGTPPVTAQLPRPAAQLPPVPVRTAAPMRTAPAYVEKRREPASAPWESEPGITFDETGLIGQWVRHSAGPSFVTEDLDAPMPRRAVAVLDANGQPGLLHVAVDGSGRVVAAAVPGSMWGPASSR